MAQAARCLDSAPTACLYARVDGCVIDGKLQLMELELVEPSLFLGKAAGAAARFTSALTRALAQRDPGWSVARSRGTSASDTTR